MKPKRNAPCPCGSGKKYKKCCYLTKEPPERNKVIPLTSGSLEIDNYYYEDNDIFSVVPENFVDNTVLDDQFVFDIAQSLHRMILDRQPHIKQYYKIRKLHSEIINTMVKYHEAGKFELKIDERESSFFWEMMKLTRCSAVILTCIQN